MMKKSFKDLLPYLLLMFAIFFNLWLYFPELSIKSDPNDNIFQFGLINQVNEVWEKKITSCKKNNFAFCILNFTFLFDHWVPQWAEGYPLPFYYSHLPQIVIVAFYRLLRLLIPISFFRNFALFDFFNLIKYLFLCFLPLSFFIAGKNFGLSPLASSLAALFACLISTDGLYGIDPPSYLWRGYGLSSQLFAIFFLPLAVSYVFKSLQKVGPAPEGSDPLEKAEGRLVPRSGTGSDPENNRSDLNSNTLKAILFLWLTSEAHLGMGLIAFLSGLVLIFLEFDLRNILRRTCRLIFIYLISLFFLSYHIIPFLYYNRYHNISYWDPIWKFNSFGFQEVGRMFLSGKLFDFGRAPILTALAVLGFFYPLISNQCRPHPDPERNEVEGSRPGFFARQSGAQNDSSLIVLSLLFPFWLALFFGSQTWGSLMEALPGLKGFHQHRFIVGVQLAGIFLAAIGAEKVIKVIEKITSHKALPQAIIKGLAFNKIAVIALISISLFPQTLRYGQYNTQLIRNANQRFEKDWPDFEWLLKKLKDLPLGRVYAGRPGNWGKEFKIGDTQVYMALSVRGIPILGFLPETWSPNSDTEQFFDEKNLDHYELYNIRYVVAPKEISFPEFAIPIDTFGKFNLYQVQTSGYFSLGTKNIAVFAKNNNFSNLVHLWLASPLVQELSFPSLSLEKNDSPDISMVNEVTYRINNAGAAQKNFNIFSRNPFFALSSSASGKILSEKVFSQRYKAVVKVDQSCQNCVLIFKMTYHPNWKFILDGKRINQQIFFSFFQGIEIAPGEHEIVAFYQPNNLRIILLVIELLILLGATTFRLFLIR